MTALQTLAACAVAFVNIIGGGIFLYKAAAARGRDQEVLRRIVNQVDPGPPEKSLAVRLENFDRRLADLEGHPGAVTHR